jgi:hypothetical protein
MERPALGPNPVRDRTRLKVLRHASACRFSVDVDAPLPRKGRSMGKAAPRQDLSSGHVEG